MEQQKKNDNLITLIIKTAITPEPFVHEFNKTTKIQEVINAAIGHFGLAPNGTYDLRIESTGEVLKPERTIVSYHLEDNTSLILSDMGVGV